jgi:hypothetical protein
MRAISRYTIEPTWEQYLVLLIRPLYRACGKSGHHDSGVICKPRLIVASRVRSFGGVIERVNYFAS